MRTLIQRVNNASVTINSKVVGQIEKGLVVLLGITHPDTEVTVDWMVNKILNLRIFADHEDKLNLSVKDIKGELLIISQFTLYGDCQKGNRPSFIEAARPEQAEKLYELFITKCRESGLEVATGKFGAMMDVALVNNGPVTVIIEK
jgi:D-aminoacyl-tRNA deacylase